MPQLDSTIYTRELSEYETLTPAFHKMFFQLTQLTQQKKATVLTEEGIRNFRRANGKKLSGEVLVYIQRTPIRNIKKNSEGTIDPESGEAECKIGGKTEWIPVKYIVSPTRLRDRGKFNFKLYANDRVAYEKDIVAGLREVIEQYGGEDGTINLTIGTHTIKDLYWAYTAPRSIINNQHAKADLILYTKHNHAIMSQYRPESLEYKQAANMRDNIFIGVKRGSSSSSVAGMEQWGGLSASGSRPWINEHPEVRAFEDVIYSWIIAGKDINTSIYVDIKDEDLVRAALFGPDANKEHGLEHVNYVAAGTPTVTSSGNRLDPARMTHTLTFKDYCVDESRIGSWLRSHTDLRPVIALNMGRGGTSHSATIRPRKGRKDSKGNLYMAVKVPNLRYAFWPIKNLGPSAVSINEIQKKLTQEKK